VVQAALVEIEDLAEAEEVVVQEHSPMEKA
jgi:hypothetical protein